jgi:hypothetical protein
MYGDGEPLLPGPAGDPPEQRSAHGVGGMR